MTQPDVLAPAGWTVPTWSAGLRRLPRATGWLTDWVQDPLERAVIVASAVLSVVLVGVLGTAEDATGATTDDSCVMAAVYDARAFAAVLGDYRPIEVAFAEDSCGLG